MINIEISIGKLKEIRELWCSWFFRENRINKFIDILDIDDIYRGMIFDKYSDYMSWKNRYLTDIEAISDLAWREKICSYCNRNFMENYSVKQKDGRSKVYFKGDLDHHYSKDEIPALALSFFNLIPSCKVCNHEKLETRKRTFYPYYDNEEKEYRFLIELYDDRDKKDIIYDRPIEDIEKKRFDSTVWQGTSDNFKIKLRGIDKIQLNECMENSNEVFRLEKKYNHSKEYVKEIIRKRYIYPEAHKEALMKNFGDVFKNDKEILETFYSYSGSGEYLRNRPLSKLTKDVLRQMGIITDES